MRPPPCSNPRPRDPRRPEPPGFSSPRPAVRAARAVRLGSPRVKLRAVGVWGALITLRSAGEGAGPGCAGMRHGDPGPEGSWGGSGHREGGSRDCRSDRLIVAFSALKMKRPRLERGCAAHPGCATRGQMPSPRRPSLPGASGCGFRGPAELQPGQTKEGPRGGCPAGLKVTSALFPVSKKLFHFDTFLLPLQ